MKISECERCGAKLLNASLTVKLCDECTEIRDGRVNECADRGAFLVTTYQSKGCVPGAEANPVCDTDEDAVTDILADLKHYCKRREIDFDNQLRIANDHFQCEQNGVD